jgi:predicted Zn-dependent protease
MLQGSLEGETGVGEETARLKASETVAGERAALRKGLPEGSPEATLFNRYLASATLFIGEKKFKEAAAALSAAEELDKSSPRVLLVRAKYYQGTDQLAKSVEMLDAYDLSATKDGRTLARAFASRWYTLWRTYAPITARDWTS